MFGPVVRSNIERCVKTTRRIGTRHMWKISAVLSDSVDKLQLLNYQRQNNSFLHTMVQISLTGCLRFAKDVSHHFPYKMSPSLVRNYTQRLAKPKLPTPVYGEMSESEIHRGIWWGCSTVISQIWR